MNRRQPSPLPGIALLWLLATPLDLHAQPETAAPPLPPRPSTLPSETQVGDLLLGLATPPGGHGHDQPDPGLRPGQPLHLRYPLAVQAQEVDPYGWRYSESRMAWRLHTGVDLIADAGTPVLAMLPGRVALVREIDGYGLTVLLDHGRGWQSLYAHLLNAGVAVGDRLRAGDPLGQVGQSGRASTPHLHVELRQRTPAGTMALDPTSLLHAAAQQP